MRTPIYASMMLLRALAGSILLAALVACEPPQPAVPYTETATGCALTQAARLPVTYVGTNSPVVIVSIQGQPERMLVDSGSYSSFISTASFQALPTHTQTDATSTGTGLGGASTITAFTSQNITLGHMFVRNQNLAISDIEIYTTNGRPDYDGVLGADFLSHFDIGLDLPNNSITLYAHQNCQTPALPWSETSTPVPLIASYGNQPMIAASIGSAKLSLMLDTGAETGLLLQSSLDHAGIKPGAITTGTGIAASDFSQRNFSIRPEKFTSLTIGAETFANPWILVATNSQSAAVHGSDGLIGNDYFSTHRIYIDNATHIAYLARISR